MPLSEPPTEESTHSVHLTAPSVHTHAAHPTAHVPAQSLPAPTAHAHLSDDVEPGQPHDDVFGDEWEQHLGHVLSQPRAVVSDPLTLTAAVTQVLVTVDGKQEHHRVEDARFNRVEDAPPNELCSMCA